MMRPKAAFAGNTQKAKKAMFKIMVFINDHRTTKTRANDQKTRELSTALFLSSIKALLRTKSIGLETSKHTFSSLLF
jgi:hypothetical protein